MNALHKVYKRDTQGSLCECSSQEKTKETRNLVCANALHKSKQKRKETGQERTAQLPFVHLISKPCNTRCSRRIASSCHSHLKSSTGRTRKDKAPTAVELLP